MGFGIWWQREASPNPPIRHLKEVLPSVPTLVRPTPISQLSASHRIASHRVDPSIRPPPRTELLAPERVALRSGPRIECMH